MPTQKSELHINETDGQYDFSRPVTKQEIVDIALHLQEKDTSFIDYLTSSTDVKRYLRLHLQDEEAEVFTVLFLDDLHGLIRVDNMFNGTVDHVSVFPREIVKDCLRYNAHSVIVAKNHLNGVAEPRHDELALYHKIKEAMDLVSIPVIDFVIIGGNDTYSFAEQFAHLKT